MDKFIVRGDLNLSLPAIPAPTFCTVLSYENKYIAKKYSWDKKLLMWVLVSKITFKTWRHYASGIATMHADVHFLGQPKQTRSLPCQSR